MAMPKKRMSHKRSGQRRNNPAKKLRAQGLTLCANCKQSVLPHNLCANCGFYAGRQVIAQQAA